MFIDSDKVQAKEVGGFCHTNVYFEKSLLFKLTVKKDNFGYEGKMFKITIER